MGKPAARGITGRRKRPCSPPISLGADDGVRAQDIGNGCRETWETPSAVETLARFDVGGCRKPVWSSPLSSSRAAVKLRSLASTSVSKGWVSKLVARYRAEGDAAFEPRSRRPEDVTDGDPRHDGRVDRRAAPPAQPPRVSTPAPTRSAGTSSTTTSSGCPERRSTAPCAATGSSPRHPGKRPRSSYIRFQAEQPNEMWQADFTHYRLTTGADVEILSWLDDHARHALSVTAHRRVTGPIVVDTFRAAVTSHGAPASTLTDNGMVFTTRLVRRHAAAATASRPNCAASASPRRTRRPNHPTTCGKVERFQQTMKTWLRAQPDQPATIAELQALLDALRRHLQPPTDPTARSPAGPRPPSPTPPAPKPPPATAATTPTTGSATTASTPAATSPCARRPPPPHRPRPRTTPEPASSCSSPTSTSASSTPPPASSSATSPSTPPAATTAPADPPAPHPENHNNPNP